MPHWRECAMRPQWLDARLGRTEKHEQPHSRESACRRSVSLKMSTDISKNLLAPFSRPKSGV